MKIFAMSGIIGIHVSPYEIRQFLIDAKGADVRFDIGSPGGFVMPGLEIFNLIRDYEGKTEVRLMGLAASMASYIALAADKRTAHDNAVYMIHNVLGVSIGDHRELRATADNFEKLTNLLAREYAKVTGKTVAAMRDMMDKETFLFGPEIAENGFVHEIIKTDKEEDRDEAVAVAKSQLDDCIAQMKAHEKAASDFSQAAAYLAGFEPNTPHKNLNDTTEEEEAQDMKLEDFLNQNPEARAEYDARIAAAKADMQKRIDKCAAVLNADYPKPITALAVKVLKGEEEPAALSGAVAILDSQKEQAATQTATGTTTATGETPPSGPSALSEDGTVANEEDMKAAAARLKGGVK